MDIKPIINNTAHKKALKALAAIFALLSFVGVLVVIVSRAQLKEGFMEFAESFSYSSFMREPDFSSFTKIFSILDAFLIFGGMTKVMSILCFAFSGLAFLFAYKTKDKVIFSAIACGASLVQFVMAIILSPVSLNGLINTITNAVDSGSESMVYGTPLAILIILMVMTVIVCIANILGIAVKMDDAQLINRFKQSSQPQYPQQMMGYPQYQQPMQPQYQQPNMMGQPMQPQYQQQPVPQAQPQYQQPVAPQPMQQPVPQAQSQYQQPAAPQQSVPQAQQAVTFTKPEQTDNLNNQ